MDQSDPAISVFEPRYAAGCRALLAQLPSWFGIPEANEAYLSGLSQLPSFVAHSAGALAGFASVRPHGDASAELEIIAVRPDLHRKGVGRALLRACEDHAVKNGASWFFVKTVGPSSDDRSYALTRKFYEAENFTPLFESTEIWNPENPCLVLIKRVQSSVQQVVEADTGTS